MSHGTLKLARVLALLAIFAGSGGHWVVLQSVAWSRMLVAYAQTAPLPRALEKTFDGQHPCALCQKIATAKKSEPHRDLSSFAVKMLLLHERTRSFLPPVRVAQTYFVSSEILRSRSDRPLLRPPRGVVLA